MAKKTATKPVSKAEQMRVRQSILCAALAKFAAKSSVRSDLAPGKDYPVAAEIHGTVGRGKVSLDLSGELHVGVETSSMTNQSPPTEEIIAAIMAEVPEAQRPRILAKLTNQFDSAKTLDVSRPNVDQAKAFLKTLRMMVTKKRAGAVSFTLGS